MKPQRILVLMHATLVPPEDLQHHSQKQIDEFRTEYDVVTQLRAAGHEVRCLGLADDLAELSAAITQWRPHIAFNLAEEFQGMVSYDQHLVSFLELMRQPYTGCNPRGLLLSRDKVLAKQIMAAHGIATPPFAVYAAGARFAAPKHLHYPLFVKSTRDDASLAISQASLVHDEVTLKQRVHFIHEQTGSAALVEEFIAGRELYVGVIGNRGLHAYPVWEMHFGTAHAANVAIATRRAKWDRTYRNKHGIGSDVARDLPVTLRRRIGQTAKRVCAALSLTGYARVDFRLRGDGELFVLEANANPCLTAHEDFARSAAAAGEHYAALLERIMMLGKRAGKALND